MKKILITGANGFLGQHLVCFLKNKGYKIIATGRGSCRITLCSDLEYHPVDLTNKDEVSKMLMEVSPDVIIHNAALSKPDECEKDRLQCLNINVNATAHLLNAQNAHFIYISTDFVFGDNGPHAENAGKDPLNFYGESKLLAEELVKKSGNKHTIVRPVFIYGYAAPGMRPSFLHWVKNNLEQRKQIKVVSDQVRTPTFVGDICSGIYSIIGKEANGEYNLAGKDLLSPYEMAIKTAEVLKLDATLIEKVTEATFPEPVKRAKKSGLIVAKAQRQLGYSPVSFEEGVRLTFGPEL